MASKVLYRDRVVSDNAESADGMRATPGEVTLGDPTSDTVAITESAAKEIKRQQEKRGTPGAMIRIGIRGGGCTGFAYVFDWASGDARPKDRVFTAHGVSVVVDHKSFEYLRGTELDFKRSMMGYGFKFNNPNAKGSCGCGESVQF